MNYDDMLYGAPLMGDAATDMEVFAVGAPDEFTANEVGALALEGAPFKKLLQKKRNSSPATTGNATASSKVARIARAATATVEQTNMPHIAIINGTIHTKSTTSSIPGGALKAMLERFAQDFPIKSMTKIAPGVVGGTPVVVNFNNVEAVLLGYPKISVPAIFVTVTSKSDSVRPGSAIGVSIAGINASGGDLTVLSDVVKRTDGARALELIITPAIKAGERLIPQMATFGTVDSVTKTLAVTVTGLLDGDSVQITTPGYDSVAYTNYLKGLNLNLI